MKKRWVTLALSLVLALSSSVAAFAGAWEPVGSDWKYKNDDGSYSVNGWQWIDGNQDGTAECYYFDANGYMLANTTTPDGYQVNSDGAWVVNGVVQTQNMSTNNNNNTNYDPNYPLKGYVEAFNLLEEPATTRGMWTYQKESHYDTNRGRMIGYNKYYLVSTLSGEQHGYYNGIDEFDINLTNEVKNFLNSFDWRNASDMEKAEHCLKWVAQATYIDEDYTNLDAYYAYGCLVNKKAVCDGFTSAFKLLANVVGLECTEYTMETALHTRNMVKIDGQWYDIETTGRAQEGGNWLDLTNPISESEIKWN